ncbi:hypothetical protein TUM19329_20280 [Legionella antarctica]|uniref:Uncharacterized protein n=1 Tax=Legionella antarctica TaxID=2708020 RepID=A0A6F8T690_9GAMM|nr:hypothetical protein TUM19329_20280 [Legionella antarctica]
MTMGSTVGLVRQYVTKSSSLVFVTDNTLLVIMNKLNSRPRKSLNYFTPNEIINGHLEIN